MHTVITLLGTLIYPVLWAVVAWKFGRVEAVRFAGIGLLLIWLAIVTAPRMFLIFEERQMAVLRGWGRFFAVLPVLAVGVLIVMYPQDAACIGGVQFKSC